MKLTLQTPTADRNQSIVFYEKLGFEIRTLGSKIVALDAQNCIEINPERTARVCIQLHQSNWNKTLLDLKSHTPIIKTKEGYLITDPNGIWIKLIEKILDEKAIRSNSKSLLGNYAGVCIETLEVSKSYEFWNLLGFSSESKDFSKGWIEMKSEVGDSISLIQAQQCPHLFFNPSMTYFNGSRNLEIIESIKKQNIEITEEVTEFNSKGEVDNIILRDSGGLGFFIFNDE